MTDLSILKTNLPSALLLFGLIFVVVAVTAGGFGKISYVPRTVAADTMLVDYYYAVKGTEGNKSYSEAVLYTTENSENLKLCIYSRDEDEPDEHCTEYTVSADAAEDCFRLIRKHRLGRWNSIKNAASTDGLLIVCKYLDGDSYVRVSTDCMPSDGDTILRSIGEVMYSYIP